MYAQWDARCHITTLHSGGTNVCNCISVEFALLLPICDMMYIDKIVVYTNYDGYAIRYSVYYIIRCAMCLLCCRYAVCHFQLFV